ncbi:MAG TPA: hypothetical protein VF850_03280 [Gemmatimonadaceae bacterium]
MGRPKSDFDALREDLRKVYDGDPWHGSSITDVLKGVGKQFPPHRCLIIIRSRMAAQ